MGFDYGTRRIGIAVGDAVTGTARPLGAFPEDWGRIGRLLDEWRPVACVVGLPLNDLAAENPVARRARSFAAALESRFGGPVHLCDERYTSRAAADALRAARASGSRPRRLKRGDEDAVAACLILEQWLAEQAPPRGAEPGP